MLLDFSAITLRSQQNEAGADEDTVQFLRFHLVPDTTAYSQFLRSLKVLTIPIGEIVPIPHMLPWSWGLQLARRNSLDGRSGTLHRTNSLVRTRKHCGSVYGSCSQRRI